MTPNVVVLDYGSGNVHSAVKALARAGAKVTLTSDPEAVYDADGLLVPGVGAFDAVMQQLLAVDGPQLIARRLQENRPVLGICVGLQIMCDRGVERGVNTNGLGYWQTDVAALEAPVLPHMGWNTVEPGEKSVLFQGIANERFYFLHRNAATHIPSTGARQPTVTWSTHEQRFVAAVEDGALSATQFHPEKSGEAGIQLLRNWISTLD